MARNRVLHEFTVQEATNVDAFSTWNYEEIDQGDTDAHACTYITDKDPAKKVVIYHDPDINGVGITAETDVVTLTINGETATNKKIKLDTGDLPFTITGLLIKSLSLTNAGGAGSESLSVLSFH
jgi:hypothetical protein